VHLSLDRLGRRLLARRLGGLGVTLLVDGRPSDYRPLSVRLRTRLYPARMLAIVWPFEIAQSTLTTRGRLLVDFDATQIRHARAVTCVGYTDVTGDRAYNLGLGMRRATTVCAALRRLGLRASLSRRTLGKGDPRASNATASGRELNRRVELEVTY
jgi:hypothetical protein